MSRSIKLHLGCGNTPIKSFINVDIITAPGVDIIYNLKDLRCFKDGYAGVIYASHFLEHFSTGEVPIIISEMYRTLRENGELRLSVPDLDEICQLYVKNIDWFTPPNNPWIGLIYGGQTNQFDFHRTGFNYRWIKFLLGKAGFNKVEKVDGFEEHGERDCSFANMPFGKISLNIRAYKGEKPPHQDRLSKEGLFEKFIRKLEILFYSISRGFVEVRMYLIRRRRKKGRF
jgi:predicted SAM-dependent methyltransferase